MEGSQIKSAATLCLMNLPTEIKLVIWEYAFGHQDTSLWHQPSSATLADGRHKYFYTGDREAASCEPCHGKDPSRPLCEHSEERERPEWHYQTMLNDLRVSQGIFNEAIAIFRSTVTIHIRSPEMIAYIRRAAPRVFREQISRVVLYVHFDSGNHFSWCMRLFELQEAFPSLKCLNIEYHMRPPVSYDNLQDVVYFYIPLLALPSPFNPVRFVVMGKERKDSMRVRNGHTGHPTTDGTPGMVFHTQYMKHELLFQARFLGDITTDDAIDEHTFVVRDLFTDPTFLATTHKVLESNRDMINASVVAAFPPKEYPDWLLARGFWDATHLPALQHALLAIARRHERPWFERLQRKRILELYVQHGGMSSREAEVLLDKQLAKMPEGQGLQEWIERVMSRADNDGGDIVAAAMLGVAIEGDDEGWPESWNQS